MEYEAVIGLETHVQLKTKSKMWCGCANQYGSEPNTNVCPVCLGLPGVLPVPNEEALRKTVLDRLSAQLRDPALRQVRPEELFLSGHAEKLPAHAIRQALAPPTASWSLNSTAVIVAASASPARTWRRTSARARISTAQRRGFQPRRRAAAGDRFRAGPHQRRTWPTNISTRSRKFCIYGGVSDCDMEKGMVRCDVNVSVRPVGTKALGAKIEIKNMNSFSGVRRALEYEIPRQIEVVQARRQAHPIHAPLGRRGGHDRGNAHQGGRARLPLFSRSRPDAARADRRVAGRGEGSASWNCRSRASSGSCANINCPPATRKCSRTTCRWEIILKPIAKQSKNPKAVANWVINNLRAKLAECSSRREEAQTCRYGVRRPSARIQPA